MSFETIALYEVADVIDSLHKTPQYSEEGYPMIRVTDIKGGYLDFSEALRVSSEVYEEFSKKYKPQIGDILVSRVGSYGNFSYVNVKNPFCLGQNTAIIVPKNVNSKFLYFWLTSIFVKEQIEQRVVGSTQKTLSLKNIKELRVPKLSNEEQIRISKLLSCLEEKININSSINKNLEEMAYALFKQWFVDFEFPNENGDPYKSSDGEFEESELGLIPRGWQLIEMGSLLSLKNERVGDREIPEYSTTNTGIKLRDEKFKKNLSKNVSKNKVVQKHDIVFGMSREILNFGVMKDAIGAVSPAYHVFKVDQGIYNAELLEVNMRVRADLFLDLIRPGAREGQGIDQQYLKRKKIIVPTKQIQDKYYEIYSDLVMTVEGNLKQNSLLSTIRDTLLPKLITGEIRVSLEQGYKLSTDLSMAAENKAQYSTT